MENFWLFALLVVLLIRWWVLSRRYAEIEQRLDVVSHDRIAPIEFTNLIRRVTRLELSVAELQGAPAAASYEAPPPTPVPVPPPPPVPEPEPMPVTALAPPILAPIVAAPRFTAPAPARAKRSSEEWEAMVGGNWLNKLGILALIVAIALFLGYSFTQMGPAGRATVALAISIALLGAGIVVERRAAYRMFARGLLAGGWAGLYFTTYAMQAVDAAKVIHNPLLGAVLLLAVACGMVAHSLKYRAQSLTALAYFMAFAALAITPATALSVVALIPLAASLLVIAYRFSWSNLALFGLVATYGTCASRGDNGAPLATAQTVFAAYWVLFESFDLLRARRTSNSPAEQAILPLNALGFAALSYAKWAAASPAELYLLAAGMAAAYLASTILRAVLRPPSSFAAETTTLPRILAGGYEGPVTLAAACSAWAAALQLHGQTVNNALLSEGELLFAGALIFRQSYLRRLAGTVFAALGWQLVFTDLPSTGTVQFLGRTLHDWSPSAAFASLLFYVNRSRRESTTGSSGVYAYAASALIALVLGFEIPIRYLGISWLGFGAALFVLGLRFRLFDFRMQGYFAGLLALGAMALHQLQIASGIAAPWVQSWISLAVAAIASYGASLCAFRTAPNRLTGTERRALPLLASWAAAATSAALLWKVLPAVYLGPAWICLGILALELSLWGYPPNLRIPAHVVAALGAAHVAFFTLLPFHTIVRADERIAIGCAALLAFTFAARLFVAARQQAEPSHEAAYVASACGSLFAMFELSALLAPMAVAPAWTILALALISIGLGARLPGLRVHGHVIAAAGFYRVCDTNLQTASVTLDISDRLWSVAIVIAAHYCEWWRQSRYKQQLPEWERRAKRLYLYTAALLIAALLFLELPAQFVAPGWGGLTLALLFIGRRWNLSDLRFQSYALALFTFWRTMDVEFHDSHLFVDQTQRIVAGILAIGCLFAAQLFCPPKLAEQSATQPAKPGNPRLYFSLLATCLATAFLFHEVTGSMLTVAWGIEGTVLLAAGFPLRDRTLRLSGLALFLICIGKLFLYDLRTLETLYRILSFFVLGVILVAVSWIYTRFRERIRQYL